MAYGYNVEYSDKRRYVSATAAAIATTTLVACALCVSPISANCPAECYCSKQIGFKMVECLSKGLTSIPEGMDNDTDILHLTDNHLQVLYKNVFMQAGLHNLWGLKLAKCNISRVDKLAFSGLARLYTLDLSDNYLAAVPSEALRETSALRVLLLNANPLRRLEHDVFGHLPNLDHLELSECQIESIAVGTFAGLQDLRNLKLNGNRLTALNKAVLAPLSTYQYFSDLELQDNPWYCDCKIRDLIKWLRTREYRIYEYGPKCTGPPSLMEYYIQYLYLDIITCPPRVTADGQADPSTSAMNAKVVEVSRGANASFVCKVSAEPEPSIHWIWQDIVISNSTTAGAAPSFSGSLDGRNYFVDESGGDDKTSTLTITGVEESDAGEYVCVAENRGGQAFVNFTLLVKENVAPTSAAFPNSMRPPRGFLWGIFVSLTVIATVLSDTVF